MYRVESETRSKADVSISEIVEYDPRKCPDLRGN